jgi:hypothetical protein
MNQKKAQDSIARHVMTTHSLVASFLRDFAKTDPEAMQLIEAAMSAGAAWEVNTRLLPCCGLPEVSITLVTADETHLHLADLTFDALGTATHKLN